MEVGPRDGLQNETSATLSVATKIQVIIALIEVECGDRMWTFRFTEMSACNGNLIRGLGGNRSIEVLRLFHELVVLF